MLRISVITPTLNSAAHLERTIRSVLDQDYPVAEYVIIDGGSTDGTVEIIRQYESKLASWVSEPDRGIADAFNKGLSRVTGDLIGIINADDYYEPGALSAMAAAYERDPQPCILHGDMIHRDHRGQRRLKPRLWRGAIHYDMPVYHPTCFVHRDVYERIGCFDTSYRYAMDFDWALRATRAGVEFRYVPRVIAGFAVGGAASAHARDVHREVYRSQRTHGLSVAVCGLFFAAKMAVNRFKKWTGLGSRPPGCDTGPC